MMTCWVRCAAVLLLCWFNAGAAFASLLRNGGFEADAAWSKAEGVSYDTTHKHGGQRSLRVVSTQGVQVEQVVYSVAPGETLTVCGWMATQEVVPTSGSGYAFMAVYQFDTMGRMVTSHDFAQGAGTHPWTYAEYTFRVHEAAEYIAVRVGIYNASGTAWFDDLNLVRGAKAVEWKEPPMKPNQETYRAAILHEPSLPVKGALTHIESFKKVFSSEKVPLTPLNASQLADPNVFNTERFDLLIVPTGASFPVEARKNLLAFLTDGGDLLCVGGYAFDNLLLRRDGKWVSYADYLRQQLARARDVRFSLVPDGGFEDGGAGWTFDNREQCKVVTEKPFSGERCGRVTAVSPHAGARFSYTLPVERGGVYLVGAHVRTENVQGPGFAFLAVYQYDQEGKLLAFRDFAQVRGTQGWQRYEERLEVAPTAAKVVFHAGLYLASGTMWIDDLTCAPIPREERINAHYGKPEDGLVIAPTQLTLFSPDQPIAGRRMVGDGVLIPATWHVDGEVVGYEATAQLSQNAVWRPLLLVQDGYGRFAGAAGALVRHFAGPFSDSTWAIFGVTNRDIFAGAQGEMLLRGVLQHLRFGLFVEGLQSDYAAYERGEVVHLRATIRNTSHAQQPVRLIWRLQSSEGKVLEQGQERMQVAPGGVSVAEWHWAIPQDAPDFVVVQADLVQGQRKLDRAESGFCVKNSAIVRQGVSITFANNAFTLTYPDSTSLRALLLGTDTYGNWFLSPSYNPLAWFREISMMHNYGLHMFENLQYHPQGYQFTEAQWRQLDAVIQISQRFGLPYMAGLLIGQDVVVDDATLAQQAEMCRQFAARYKNVPGLIYYLNGDFRLNLKDTPDIRRLWNDFLRQRYLNDEALRAAWAPYVPPAKLGEIPVQNAASTSWYEVRTRDVREFQTFLMRRWINALCEAIRREDQRHPITSEYYQRPFDGIDLRLTLNGMDASNIGYFNPPGQDLAQLMASIKWNDMRFVGKTVNIGEFGVKTHDAWKPELGGTHYHIQRTEWQQRQLFWWVVHAALALDVTKVQNWCWTDDPDRVFPWGIVWNNPLRAKPVLKLYRNLRIFSDRVPRDYTPADVLLVLPDNWRLGAPEGLAHGALMNAIECLLATGVNFDVVNESDLPSEPVHNAPSLLLMPLAYTLSDTTIQRLTNLLERGCKIYLSGDPSTDTLGRRHPERLEKLCGVRLVDVEEHPSGLPQPRVTPAGAVFRHEGVPVPYYQFAVGRGVVFYTPIPWETLPGRDVFGADAVLTASPDSNLYLHLLSLQDTRDVASVRAGSGIWRTVVTTGKEKKLLSLFPRHLSPEVTKLELKSRNTMVEMTVRGDLPIAILFNTAQEVVQATGSGSLRVDGKLLAEGDSAWMLVSLDNKPLAASQMLAASMLDGGKLRYRSEATGLSAWVVDWHDGIARTLAQLPLRRVSEGWEITVPAGELVVVCPTEALKEALSQISFRRASVNTPLTTKE